ncbi:hypothetical protein [Methylomonas sp. YC3]
MEKYNQTTDVVIPQLYTVSINKNWWSKPLVASSIAGNTYHTNQGGKRINLAKGWETVHLPFADIFNHLTVDGFPICASLRNGYRKSTNFICHSIAMVDIDHGLTLEELRANPFYVEYGTGYYVTPSHTDEHPRFRVLFALEHPIDHPDDMTWLYTILLQILGGDKACKDASRFFNGTQHCPDKALNADRQLPTSVVKTLIEDHKNRALVISPPTSRNRQGCDTQNHTSATPSLPASYTLPSTHEKSTIIQLLLQTFCGYYPTWRDIGWGMKYAGFSLEDYQTVTSSIMNKKSAIAAAALWNSHQPVDQVITLGTVIHYLYEQLGETTVKSKLMLARIEREQSENERIKERLAQLKQRKVA